MLNRHQGREVVVKSLFLKDFYKNIPEKDDNLRDDKWFYDTTIEEYIEEGKTEKNSIDKFSKDRYNNINKKIAVIDEVLQKAAPKWPIEKIFSIDRNILRLGIYELLFEKKDVPAKVVINEAIELAKTFGNKTSKKFVSGVLGSLYEVVKKEEVN